MEIKEAFEILQLDIDSSKDTIETKFKELSMKVHPDKGGSDEEMSKLLTARELAIEFASNKSLIKVFREIAKSDNNEIQKSSAIDIEVTSIYNRAKRRVGNKLKSFKDITGFVGIISGILTLITSEVVPILKIAANSTLSTLLLFASIAFAFYYLIFSNSVKKLEENISDFKDTLDDKEDFYYMLADIFGEKRGARLNREELLDSIANWSESSRENGSPLSPSIIFFSSHVSPKRICRLIGPKDFAKMIILKGEQFKFIEVTEGSATTEFKRTYKILHKPAPNISFRK